MTEDNRQAETVNMDKNDRQSGRTSWLSSSWLSVLIGTLLFSALLSYLLSWAFNWTGWFTCGVVALPVGLICLLSKAPRSQEDPEEARLRAIEKELNDAAYADVPAAKLTRKERTENLISAFVPFLLYVLGFGFLETSYNRQDTVVYCVCCIAILAGALLSVRGVKYTLEKWNWPPGWAFLLALCIEVITLYAESLLIRGEGGIIAWAFILGAALIIYSNVQYKNDSKAKSFAAKAALEDGVPKLRRVWPKNRKPDWPRVLAGHERFPEYPAKSAPTTKPSTLSSVQLPPSRPTNTAPQLQKKAI